MLPPLNFVDILRQTQGIASYYNRVVAAANDHVVRLSVMTEPYHWHQHPNSDEVFLGVEGIVCLDLPDGQTVELGPGQLYTVPAGTRHRTRPKGSRSVNLTFERADLETVAA